MGNRTDIKRPVTTSETSFKIVRYLLNTGGATITEVSNELDLSGSTAHRHISTLMKHDFIMKRDREYRVGLRFLGIGVTERKQRPLYESGKAPVDQLSASIEKRAWLSSFENNHSVTLHWANDRDPLHQYSQVGQQHPISVTAAGKAMLSQLSDDEVERIIEQHGLPAKTKDSITDPQSLFESLQETRKRGFAISKGECFTGVEAIAAPIYVKQPDVLGSVAIGRSFSKQDDTLKQKFAGQLLETASEIEVKLRS